VAPGREHVKQKDVCGVEQPRLKEFEECHIGGDLWELKVGIFTTPGSSAKSLRIVSTLRTRCHTYRPFGLTPRLEE
jgi:hypothetical protein